MKNFLVLVAVLSYLATGFALVVTFSSTSGSDLQLLLAGVFAVCGTVAAAGAAIVGWLEIITAQLDAKLGVKAEE